MCSEMYSACLSLKIWQMFNILEFVLYRIKTQNLYYSLALTPAKFISVRKIMTAAATRRSTQGDPSSPPAITPAMDSPNPVAQSAFPIAYK